MVMLGKNESNGNMVERRRRQTVALEKGSHMGLAYLIHLVIRALIIVIIADALLSWVPELRYRWRELTRIIESISKPILAPFRRLIPPSKTGGLDLSPLLAWIALNILERVIMMLLAGLRFGP